MTSIRITHRPLLFLSETHAWKGPTPGSKESPEEEVMRLISGVKPRKDGSKEVNLTAAQRAILADYIDVFAIGAADNAGPWDTDATADLNSARALLRQIARLKETP